MFTARRYHEVLLSCRKSTASDGGSSESSGDGAPRFKHGLINEGKEVVPLAMCFWSDAGLSTRYTVKFTVLPRAACTHGSPHQRHMHCYPCGCGFPLSACQLCDQTANTSPIAYLPW